MQQFTALTDLHLSAPTCLTIGAFDGVHKGHQALIGTLVQHAHATERLAAVLTFVPHPAQVLRGPQPGFYLATLAAKAAALAALGVDVLITHPFNREVAAITAADFVTQLVQTARLSELWCGADFALGHNRVGNVAFLQAVGVAQGFTVRVFDPVVLGTETISSTRIRQLLREGAVEQAAQLLGRPYQLTGPVVQGAQRGRTLGIPTANVAYDADYVLPATGVYACYAHTATGATALAVTNIGFRPTFAGGDAQPTIEAHLLDFAGDLYGQPVTLDFVARLRAETKFSGVEALLTQIRQDIAAARQLLL